MFVNCGWEMNWKNDLHTCWTISGIVSYVHLKNFRCLRRDSNPWLLQCWCSAPTNWAMKPLRCEEVNLLGSCVPWSHLSGFIAQLKRTLHRYRTGHGSESRWKPLTFFRCTYEPIAARVQQVWGSFLQFNWYVLFVHSKRSRNMLINQVSENTPYVSKGII